MDDIGARVRALAASLAQASDVDLVAVDVQGAGPRRLVRISVDRKGGVTLAECEAFSRSLSEALDDEDPIPDRYALEVTSPGTDHPLEGQRAFDRVEGRAVLVHYDDGDGASRQARGTVTGTTPEAVVLDIDGGAVEIPYAHIVKATQALPW